MAEFEKIAKVSDIGEGDMKNFRVGSRDALVANIEGEFFAVDNACPHVGAPLSQGMLRDGIVTCPLHGWQFHVKTGEGKMPPGAKLGCFEVKIEGDDILLSVE